MIASISKGGGVLGLLKYLLGDPDSPRGLRVAGNMAGKTIRELSAEFGLIRKMRPTLGRAIAHISLSLPPSDRRPSASEWSEVAETFIREMGFDDCPWVAFEHCDTEHHHIHLAISRIRANGTVVPDAGDFRRAQAISRQLEKAYNFLAVSSQKSPTTKRRSKMKNKADRLIAEAADEIDPETSRFSRSEEPTEEAWATPIFEDTEDMTIASPRSYPKNTLTDLLYRDSIGTELTRIDRNSNGAVLHLRPMGMIRDTGNRLGAYHLDDEHAAALLVDLSDAKGWTEITLTGPQPFVKKAMELAVKRGIKVIPKDKEQEALLMELVATQAAKVGNPSVKQQGIALPLVTSMKNKLANLRTDEKKKGGGSSGGQRPKAPTQKRPGGMK